MSKPYFVTDDLKDFPNIGEFAPELAEKFFDYYGTATSAGLLTDREKALIALVVAATQNCPFCIDAYTNKCLSLGISKEEMMEGIHVGSSMMAGITLAHSTLLRKIVKEKEM